MKTMKFFIISCMLVISSMGVLFADTNVSGNIESDITWTQVNSPYIVTGNVTVLTGVTLTVDDNVTVKFNDGLGLYVYGTISAVGSTYGITFTSTNASPSPGDWAHIQIGNSSYSGSATFQKCQIEYADQLYLYNGTTSLTDCYLDYFYYYGVQIYGGGTLTMTNTDIDLTGYYTSYGYGIYVRTGSDATLNNVNISNCSYGLLIDASDTSADLTDCNINSCNWPITDPVHSP